jgi:hypothetical protein
MTVPFPANCYGPAATALSLRGSGVRVALREASIA